MFIANLVIAALLTVCDFFISWDAWGSGDVFDETMSQALKINVWLSIFSLAFVKIPKAYLIKRIDQISLEDCAKNTLLSEAKLKQFKSSASKIYWLNVFEALI